MIKPAACIFTTLFLFLGDNLQDWSSMDCIDSTKFSTKKAGAFSNAALISEIDRKMKEHVDVLLHSVEFLSTRVSQLESKTHQIEDVVDDIKESLELNQGITDGKLREMKNILVEVLLSSYKFLLTLMFILRAQFCTLS